MKDMNTAALSGRLTKDPELRGMANGTDVLTFRLAFNGSKKTRDGWEDKPNYINCKLFGSRAGKLAGMLKRGSQVAIQGRLDWSEWYKEGEKRDGIELIVDEMIVPNPSKEPAYYDDDTPF